MKGLSDKSAAAQAATGHGFRPVSINPICQSKPQPFTCVRWPLAKSGKVTAVNGKVVKVFFDQLALITAGHQKVGEALAA